MTVEMRGERWLVQTLLSVLVFVCFAASARAAGEYRTIEVESLKITVDSEWAPRTTPGYLPVRFDITNLGEARVIDIVGRGMRFFMSSGRPGTQGGLELQQTIRLARGDRVRFTLPVPVLADHESLGFEIQEDGRTLQRMQFSTGFESRSPAADASALIVADPSSAFGTAAASWRRPMTFGTRMSIGVASGAVTASGVGVSPGSSRAPGPPPLDFLLEPARLPTNWLGYTSVRAVVIGTTEWEQLSDQQKTALMTWTACGGDLIVVDGDLHALIPGARRAAPSDATVRAYFFGRIHVPTFTSFITMGGGLTGALRAADKVRDANWSLPANRAADWGTIGARGFRLPIPGVTGVPARRYLLILLAFSLVIGPVNYWFLLYKGRQVLLVLTVPLISAVFILLLGGYVVAGEGFGVRGRAMTFTMLDQVRMQAVTRASISLYASGMAPGGGLRFPRDVAVFAIGTNGQGSRAPHTMELSELQRYSSGVIQARSPTNLEELVFRPARERLSFNVEGHVIGVVNGLDSSISTLVYRIGNRSYSLAAPLPAGGKGVLQPDGRSGGVAVPTDLPVSTRLQHLFANQPEGSYLAILERSPFWDPGVSRLDERRSFHLVIGWPGGQP